MITRRETILAAASAALLSTALPLRRATAQASVAAASLWSEGLGARMRLVRGAPIGGAEAFAAGVEIALAPGFRTYWRMPGSAGVPPIFDWSASQNLGSVTPDWPAPRRLEEEGV